MTMHTMALDAEDDRTGFWRHARAALYRQIPPDRAIFALPGASDDLFARASSQMVDQRDDAIDRIEPALRPLIDDVVIHADAGRFALAYRLLWRAARERNLAAIASDPDVVRARAMAASVHRDKHKMKAFVRFREAKSASGKPRFIAWFEPEHHIVRDIAPFFANRFAGMCWSILTPRRSAHWDGEALSFSEGASRSDAPDGDAMEDVWRTYYGSTFNPARVSVKAMTSQMPKKYWHNLPEASLIAPLVRTAEGRAMHMIEAAPTEPRREARSACTPAEMAPTALDACRRCSLWRNATQAVPGQGPANARLMIVGEQPGDQEDIAGAPFVGPAGQLLSKALERVGIDRASCYLTNAVKHFKFEPRGKNRLHKSPSREEIDHCRWWLDQERALVRPQVLVALGVSAVRGITGRSMTLASIRSAPITIDDTSQMIATVHPAFLLRLSDEAQKRDEWRRFLDDLALARRLTETNERSHQS